MIPNIRISLDFYAKDIYKERAFISIIYTEGSGNGGGRPCNSKGEAICAINRLLNRLFESCFSVDIINEIDGTKIRLKRKEWKGVWFGIKMRTFNLKRLVKPKQYCECGAELLTYEDELYERCVACKATLDEMREDAK